LVKTFVLHRLNHCQPLAVKSIGFSGIRTFDRLQNTYFFLEEPLAWFDLTIWQFYNFSIND